MVASCLLSIFSVSWKKARICHACSTLRTASAKDQVTYTVKPSNGNTTNGARQCVKGFTR